MKPYYYVFKVGVRHPRIKHATIELATAESERLARLHPGETFEILMCLGVTKTINPHTSWMDGVVPPHICEMHRIMDDTCYVCGEYIPSKEVTP
jgi:hypothetical protein